MIVKTKCDHHFPSLSFSLSLLQQQQQQQQFIHVDLAFSMSILSPTISRDSSSFIVSSLYFVFCFFLTQVLWLAVFSFFLVLGFSFF
jgi:hypothetical protein